MTTMIQKNNNKNYRNGGVSIVAVIFGTIVMSLIALSFLAQMRSGLTQNAMYTASQAAYDAAMTGVMDTQLAISECRRNPGTGSSQRAIDCHAILSGNDNCDAGTIAAIERVIFGGIRGGVVDTNSNQTDMDSYTEGAESGFSKKSPQKQNQVYYTFCVSNGYGYCCGIDYN